MSIRKIGTSYALLNGIMTFNNINTRAQYQPNTNFNNTQDMPITGKTNKAEVVQDNTARTKIGSSNIAKNLTDKTTTNFHNRIANFFNKGREDALNKLKELMGNFAKNDINASAFLKKLAEFKNLEIFKNLPESTRKSIDTILNGKLKAKIDNKTTDSFHNKIANFFNKGRKKALNNLAKDLNDLNELAKYNDDGEGGKKEIFQKLPKSIQQAAIEYAKQKGIDIDPNKVSKQAEPQKGVKKVVPQQNSMQQAIHEELRNKLNKA